MTRVALDSNILIHAELEPDSEKGGRAADLILHAAQDGVIPAQVLGEFLRFVQRRMPAAFEEAIRQVSIYQAAFLTPPRRTPLSIGRPSWRALLAYSSGIAWCARLLPTPARKSC